MIVVNDFSSSKDINFKPMRSDLKKDYSSSSNVASDKKEMRADLLKGLKEYQTFFEILGPI